MTLDARELVENAVDWHPGIAAAARMSGIKWLISTAAVLGRVRQYPETKEALIAWMQWTRIFSSADDEGPPAEPSLPAEYSDLQEDMVDMRLVCQDCDEDCDNSCSDPAA